MSEQNQIKEESYIYKIKCSDLYATLYENKAQQNH